MPSFDNQKNVNTQHTIFEDEGGYSWGYFKNNFE